MPEFGVWSGQAGGFIDAGFYTPEAGQDGRAELIAAGEDPEDLEVLPLCGEPGHDEQPADGCNDCAEEEPE